jgi:hypothetical protein
MREICPDVRDAVMELRQRTCGLLAIMRAIHLAAMPA